MQILQKIKFNKHFLCYNTFYKLGEISMWELDDVIWSGDFKFIKYTKLGNVNCVGLTSLKIIGSLSFIKFEGCIKL